MYASEKKATPKAAFGFRRDNEQTACEAGEERQGRGFASHENSTRAKRKRRRRRHLVFAAITSKRPAKQAGSAMGAGLRVMKMVRERKESDAEGGIWFFYISDERYDLWTE